MDRERFALEVVSTSSPSGGEAAVAGLIADRLGSLGLKARVDGVGNVVCGIGGGGRTLLLCGHMDTVGGHLEAKLVGGVLYGRGAVDAKGALLSLLYAFEDLASMFEADPDLAGRLRVLFAAVVQEEGDSRGVRRLIEDGVRAEAAVFGEPSGLARVGVGYRGRVPFRAKFRTRESHAGAPWLTRNALEEAYSFYQKVRSEWPCTSGRLVDCVSVALTRLCGGSGGNVVPGEAELELDIRVPFGLSAKMVGERVLGLAREASSREVSVECFLGDVVEPYRVGLGSKIVRAFARAILRAGGRPEYVLKSGTGDMNVFSAATGAECVSYGPGDPKLSHTAEERVEFSEIVGCSQIVRGAVLEYAWL